MESITFTVAGTDDVLRVPQAKLAEFVVLKLLHGDNNHVLTMKELTSPIVADIQNYIDHGTITLDQTIDCVELLGNNINAENLPRDMIKLYLDEQAYRNKVNQSNVELPSFTHLIELTENEYSKMNRVARKYSKNVSGYLRFCEPHRPKWSRIQERIKELLKCISYIDKAFPENIRSRLMIAGGSICSLLHDTLRVKHQDLDIFVVAQTEDTDAIISHFAGLTRQDFHFYNPDCLEIYYCETSYNDNVISIKYNSRPSLPEIQIVKRFYKTFDQILHGFDIDASCVGVTFDGKIWMTPRFKYAFMKNCLTVNVNRLSPTYEIRLAKYHRRGWDLYVPGTLTKPIPEVSIDVDGEIITFGSVFSEPNEEWLKLDTLFKSVDDQAQRYLLSKVSRKWRLFGGIDMLWIATQSQTELRTTYYDTNRSTEINSKWRIDQPDTQHTGSFQPLPRDTKWFNSTLFKYFEHYAPIAHLAVKHKFYVLNEVNQLKHASRWRTHLLYQYTKFNQVIYLADYIINQFMKLYDVKYSELEFTPYMLLIDFSTATPISYVIDTTTEMMIGVLHNDFYGALLNIISVPGEDLPSLTPPPFKPADFVCVDYISKDCELLNECLNIFDLVRLDQSIKYRYSTTIKSPTSSYSPEFVQWFNQPLPEDHLDNKIEQEDLEQEEDPEEDFVVADPEENLEEEDHVLVLDEDSDHE